MSQNTIKLKNSQQYKLNIHNSMFRKQKKTKWLRRKNLSAKPKKFTKWLNKKTARFLAAFFFCKSPLKQDRQVKKRLLKIYKWFFTHNKLYSFKDKEELIDKNNLEHSLSFKFIWKGSKFILNSVPEKSARKELREYLRLSFKSFRKEDHSHAAIRRLRQTKKAKLPFSFFQPWKKIWTLPTQRQHWLKTTYSRYQTLRFKDRIDFFRTYIGQIVGNMYWEYEKERDWTPYSVEPQTVTYFKFSLAHTNGWWYENLVQKRQNPKSAKRFILDRPKTAFQIHWTQQQLEPWKNALLFKRALYSGFGEDYRKENKFKPVKIKNYLRSKNPRQEKRNRLYARVNFLLNNFRQRYRIRADKFARIKQVASKIVNPFYGHLRPRQIKRLLTKSKKVKSKFLGFHEIILSSFENRLDVTVYRLNLAPSILWARRLIKAGVVFVSSPQNGFLWESMYRGFKKLAFPLKLRDPKNLYAKTYWTYNQENWVEFKFLGQPKKNISYLLQPGDLIQCATGTYLNHFKTQPWLCRKPIPAHLLVQKKRNYTWHWHSQRFKKQTFKSWEQNSESLFTAIFLHSPQFRDLDAKDRIKESFLRWAML